MQKKKTGRPVQEQQRVLAHENQLFEEEKKDYTCIMHYLYTNRQNLT